MVITTDCTAHLRIFIVPCAVDLLQNVTALHRVGFHIFKLVLIKPARLQKYTVPDRDLTDIMQCTCRYDNIDLLRGQTVLRILLGSTLCEDPRKALHTLDVLTTLQITVLYNSTKYINNIFVILLDLDRLLLQQLVLPLQVICLYPHLFFQPVFVLKQIHDILDTAAHCHTVERLPDKFGNAKLQTFSLNLCL